VEEDSTTKASYEDSICHEVKYDPTNKESDTYKKYIKPFFHGTSEQWLKFMEDLNVIIRGDGLDDNSLAHFNLTCSSLKGEALHIFNVKAAKQIKRQVILIFNVSVLSRNTYSPNIIHSLNRKPICTTTCSCI
jgi:hypothetical protein